MTPEPVLTRSSWPFRKHPVAFEQAQAHGLYRGFGGPATDGDTVPVLLDLGFYRSEIIKVRIAGVDCPETVGTTGEEHERAREAENFTRRLAGLSPVLVMGTDEMSFRRAVSRLLVSNVRSMVSVDLSEIPNHNLGGQNWYSVGRLLLAEGHAEPYEPES